MIATVVGARPQFVKAATLSRALRQAEIEETIIHTGQHYDEKMSDVFWRELGLPDWTINLEAGSGSHGVQTAKMIEKMESFLLSLKPSAKALLLYGDTNSTLAGAIVASKIGLPIIHVEAGLRSFNRTMPEEINRVVTDHLSALLFCSSGDSVQNLANEGITGGVYNTGDVMFDAIRMFSEDAGQKMRIADLLPFPDQAFNLLTMHRPANTENGQHLSDILSAIGKTGMPVIWPLHPRLRGRLAKMSIPSNVHVIEPLSYFEMLTVLKHCYKVFTDSGGLQKEAYWMQKPCITLRPETEWVETIHDGWNTVTDFKTELIENAFRLPVRAETWYPVYGDGNAAGKIAARIKEFLK
jgi:UDP-N-acetylglucosamine 2-epimerase